MSTDCNDLNVSMVKNIIVPIINTLKHICNVSLTLEYDTFEYVKNVKDDKVFCLLKV